MVVRRGYRRPPPFALDRLRDAPVGHFFDVMTNGFGAMPDYTAQVKVPDRWAIAAYIRALQLRRNAKVADLPAELRDKLPKDVLVDPAVKASAVTSHPGVTLALLKEDAEVANNPGAYIGRFLAGMSRR